MGVAMLLLGQISAPVPALPPGLGGLLQGLGPLLGQLRPSPTIEVKVEGTYEVKVSPEDEFVAVVPFKIPAERRASVERALRSLGASVEGPAFLLMKAGGRVKIVPALPPPQGFPAALDMVAKVEGTLGRLRAMLPKVVDAIVKSGGSPLPYDERSGRPYAFLWPKNVERTFAEAIGRALEEARMRAGAAARALGTGLGPLVRLTLERVEAKEFSCRGTRGTTLTMVLAEKGPEPIKATVKVSLTAQFETTGPGAPVPAVSPSQHGG